MILSARPIVRTLLAPSSLNKAARPTSRFLSSVPSFLNGFRYEVAVSIHGKPGSPVYSPPGTAPEETDNSGRPDWRGQNQPGRLQQGLPSDHPCSLWVSEQLAKMSQSAGPSHPEKPPAGASSGHDWFYVEEQPDGQGVSLGIADGVGGWEESGVDPSHFAQYLMWSAREEVRKGGSTRPKDLMAIAHDAVLAEKGVIAGSSTACIVSLDAATGLMRAANLGDSTFLLCRPMSSIDPSAPPTTPPAYQVIHNQPSMTHFFNAPKQLAKLPRGQSKAGAILDSPKGADLVELMLKPGDIFLMATDGFVDNVFPAELEQLVSLVADRVANPPTPVDGQPAEPERSLAQYVADVAVNFARLCSFKPNKESPFEVEARRYGHHDLKGGKVDDVCVIAVVVKEA